MFNWHLLILVLPFGAASLQLKISCFSNGTVVWIFSASHRFSDNSITAFRLPPWDEQFGSDMFEAKGGLREFEDEIETDEVYLSLEPFVKHHVIVVWNLQPVRPAFDFDAWVEDRPLSEHWPLFKLDPKSYASLGCSGAPEGGTPTLSAKFSIL